MPIVFQHFVHRLRRRIGGRQRQQRRNLVDDLARRRRLRRQLSGRSRPGRHYRLHSHRQIEGLKDQCNYPKTQNNKYFIALGAVGRELQRWQTTLGNSHRQAAASLSGRVEFPLGPDRRRRQRG